MKILFLLLVIHMKTCHAAEHEYIKTAKKVCHIAPSEIETDYGTAQRVWHDHKGNAVYELYWCRIFSYKGSNTAAAINHAFKRERRRQR